MKKLVALGFILFSLLTMTGVLHAATAAIPASLTDTQKATLTASLAEKKSYPEIIRLALEGGMPCDAVVAFLCAKANNAPAAVYDIVYAAISEGCDAAKIIAAAVKGGAPLAVVVRAARAAGASDATIREGATNGGASAEEIANAFAALLPGGGAGGGFGGDGDGASIGGGGGGAVNASESNPSGKRAR